MANAQRHITETPREYEGEKQAERLLKWLNTTKDVAGKKRILAIMQMIHALAHYESKKEPRIFVRGEQGGIREADSPDANARLRVNDDLHTALGYYTMRPTVAFLGGFDQHGRRDSEPILSLNWYPVAGSRMSRHQFRIRSVDRDSDTEATAIKTALGLMESGAIFKIELCRCGRFFFKRFSHQNFCTSKCRLADFRESDAARQKRNDYARKLYHLHKKLDSGRK